MIDRRNFLAAGVATVAAGLAPGSAPAVPAPAGSSVRPAPAGFVLRTLPGNIYKRSADRNRLRLDQWLFFLVLFAPEARKPAIRRLVANGTAGGRTVQEIRFEGKDLEAMDLVPTVAAAPGSDSHRVAAFQIAGTAPQALAVDGVDCGIEWADDVGGVQRLQGRFPITAYTQRTDLVFPFRGKGLITQGGGWNDGHRNPSGMFAVDAIGLTELYAPMLASGDAPEAAAGWGRGVIAPAAGVVVVARGDRPDQPVTGVSDPKYFVPEHPQGGDPGNHCIIDHGNGEFSMLAHFQHGSLRVKAGDRVEQGQVLGKLGNSGDSDMPHVHYQLQSGPDWTQADALPPVFANGPKARHDRGEFFDAG